MSAGFDFARVQDAAFEVLAKRGQVALLLRTDNRPEYLFNISLERLLQAISSARLHSMLPLLDSLAQTLQDTHELLKVAWVCADLGYMEKAQALVDRCRQSSRAAEYVSHDILSGIHHLPEAYALDAIDDIWTRYRKERLQGDPGYLSMLYVESLERLVLPKP